MISLFQMFAPKLQLLLDLGRRCGTGAAKCRECVLDAQHTVDRIAQPGMNRIVNSGLQISEPAALLLALPHQLADRFVSQAHWYPAKDQCFHERGGVKKA